MCFFVDDATFQNKFYWEIVSLNFETLLDGKIAVFYYFKEYPEPHEKHIVEMEETRKNRLISGIFAF